MFKKILESKLVFIGMSFAVAVGVLVPFYTRAETRITDGYLYEGARWTKEGSPYILEAPVFLPTWHKLRIDAGVVVRSGPVPEGEDPYSLGIDGDLSIEGSPEDPVILENLGSIFLSNSTTTIKHAVLKGTGINASKSRLTIASSSISEASPAVALRRSVANIWGSEIIDNDKGIISNLWIQGPVLAMAGSMTLGDLGGVDVDYDQNIISIKNSVLERNNGVSVHNKTPNLIDARDNWWGSSLGPESTTMGSVTVDPWKIEDPRIKKVECCSNVLFLPGLKASRLYKTIQGDSGVKTNTLWEPNRNEDVRKLFLDSDGKSIDPSIYVNDVLDEAFGVSNIYKSFIAMMKAMVADKTINEWLPFAYDWRNDVSSVVFSSVNYGTTTKLLVSEVEKLAQTSKTGKVTIVAHSNGGLVAKALGKELERLGKNNLIDKVTFVAVPQLGTPQAIASMLHGDDESLLGGVILKSTVARALALNMPGAYGLLPSSQFFNHIVKPVVSFATSSISSYKSMADFLVGKTYPRNQPTESDLETPALLSSNLLSKAQGIHDNLDTWEFPTTTPVYFISGWGKDTTESVQYLKEAFSLKKTLRGDGVVVLESSKGPSSQNFFFNQRQFKRDTRGDIKHSTILEAGPVRNIISSILSKNSAAIGDLSLPAYISKEEPRASDYSWIGSLVVSVHSPVDIDVYDSKGGHIGLVPLKDKVSGYGDSDLMYLENTIGGEYEDLAGHKYVYLPTDTEETYSVQLKGTGVGTFTFQVQKFDNEMNEVASTTYADLPVTPLLVASTSVNALSIAPPLNLDVDGNGKVDIQVKPNTIADPLIHLEAMKKVIVSLGLKPLQEKLLLARLEVMRALIKNGKIGKWLPHIKKVSQKSIEKHWKVKGLTDNDRTMLIKMFNEFLDSIGAK